MHANFCLYNVWKLNCIEPKFGKEKGWQCTCVPLQRKVVSLPDVTCVQHAKGWHISLWHMASSMQTLCAQVRKCPGWKVKDKHGQLLISLSEGQHLDAIGAKDSQMLAIT